MEGRRMAKDIWKVVKFNLRTGKVENDTPVFSSTNPKECELRAQQENDKLAPAEKQDFVYRCCEDNPQYRVILR